ncbi:MAG: PASTA domain-containing protein, partial [Nakamurella sp.]
HSDVPAPSGRAIGTPDALDDLIVAATSRDPADRPRDASAFLTELVGIRSQLGLRRVPVPVPQRRPAPAPATATAQPAFAAQVGASGTRVMSAGPVTVADPPRTFAPPQPDQPRLETVSVAFGVDAGSGPPATVALRRRRQKRWLIAVLVVLLLGMSAAAGGWWLGGRWSSAPAAVGLSQESAEALVRAAGLVPRVRTEHRDDVPSGTVAGTEPAAGAELLRGSEVALLVSSGRPEVPSILPGTSPTTASAAIAAADLTAVIGTEPAFDNLVPVGAALRTDPAAGTLLTVDAHVTVVISAGPEPLQVPDITGKSSEDAENKLVVAGFVIGPARPTFDPRAEAGSVLGSTPAAGSTAPRGSEVSLQIASALTVPEVRGKSTTDAQKLLAKAGFTVTVGDPAFDPDIDQGEILRTDPGPGAKVDPNNAKIFLVPSNAIQVPDLDGRTIKQAAEELDKLGLKLRVSAFFGADDGTVWDQSPGPGGRVAPSGTVSVTAFP